MLLRRTAAFREKIEDRRDRRLGEAHGRRPYVRKATVRAIDELRSDAAQGRLIRVGGKGRIASLTANTLRPVGSSAGKRLARFVLLLPWAVPVSLAAMAWTWILDSTFSVVNWTLKVMGLLDGWLYWLGEPNLAVVAIILVHVWRLFPLATVLILAGISAIPTEVLEASIVDGAGFWRRLGAWLLSLLPIEGQI